MQVQFSIIIPTYNRPATLSRAVASVLSQSYTNWELIIVDDGSASDAREAASALSRKDQRISYYEQANAGPSAARQKGIVYAKGIYLCFLDDDDYFEVNHLQVFANYIELHPATKAILRTGIHLYYHAQKVVSIPNYDNSTDGLLQYWSRPCGMLCFAVPLTIARACPMLAEEQIIEDFAWFTRLLLLAPLVQLPTYTCYYTQHPANRSLLLNDAHWLEQRVEIIKQLYSSSTVKRRVPAVVYRSLLTHQCWHFTRQCILSGENHLAWYSFKKGWGHAVWPNRKELMYTIWLWLKTKFTGLSYAARD